MAFLRVLSAEWLKTKRTLALWLVPIAPLVIIGMQLAIELRSRAYPQQQDPETAWASYGQQIVFLWAIMMLPLFITLETALLSSLEHNNQQWKHLFALPVPRGAVYLAKQVSGMVLIGLSTAVLYVYLVLGGLALRVLAPGLGFEAPVPWLMFLKYAAVTYLASWLILSIHTWVGLRWHSFVVASAVGIFAMVIAVFLFESDYSGWYPWTLPGLVTFGLRDGILPLAGLATGCLGGIAAALVGGWEVIRRDVL
jgi:hypothetical protein